MPAAGTIWKPFTWGVNVWREFVWADVGDAPTPPHIVFTPSALEFSTAFGGGNPAAKAVTITNGGGGSVTPVLSTISTDNGGSWLSAELVGSTLTVTATLGALAAGVYTGTVAITSSGADNTPRLLPVTFNVTGTPGSGSGISGPAGSMTAFMRFV